MTGMRWMGTAAGLLLLSLLLGLGLVWCNIERFDLAYKLKELQEDLEQTQELVAKLEVERDNLLSPHRLRARAREFHLGPARQGQIRHLSLPGNALRPKE